MTVKEAGNVIEKYLRCRKEPCNDVLLCSECDLNTNEIEQDEAFIMAIKALNRSEIPNSCHDDKDINVPNNDCKYCHVDADGYVKPIEKNGHAFIRCGMNGWVLSLKGGGWHGECKIRYCPMCGRDLLECISLNADMINADAIHKLFVTGEMTMEDFRKMCGRELKHE